MNPCIIIMLTVTIAVSAFAIVRELEKPYKVLHHYCNGTVVEYNYHNPPKRIRDRLKNERL